MRIVSLTLSPPTLTSDKNTKLHRVEHLLRPPRVPTGESEHDCFHGSQVSGLECVGNAADQLVVGISVEPHFAHPVTAHNTTTTPNARTKDMNVRPASSLML